MIKDSFVLLAFLLKKIAVYVSGLVDVFPNPATDFLTIIEQGIFIEEVELMDIMGRVLLIENEKVNMKNMDLTNVSKGAYVLKIYTDRGVVVKKVVVK